MDNKKSKRPLRLLMVGNSFSICVGYNLPQIALEAGIDLRLGSAYIGGCSMQHHLETLETPRVRHYRYDIWNTSGGMLEHSRRNTTLRVMLADGKWDIITIQQASPASFRPESYEPYAEQLIALIRKYQPKARILIQQTWSYNAAHPCFGTDDWPADNTDMFNRLEKNYADLSARYGLGLIPAGRAVQLARTDMTYGDVVGNGDDKIHLAPRGEYMQACVWAGFLWGLDVRKLRYRPDGIPDADFLRDCACRALNQS